MDQQDTSSSSNTQAAADYYSPAAVAARSKHVAANLRASAAYRIAKADKLRGCISKLLVHGLHPSVLQNADLVDALLEARVVMACKADELTLKAAELEAMAADLEAMHNASGSEVSA